MTEKTPDKKLARIDIKLLNNTAREFLRLKLTLENDLGMKITNTQVVEHMLHTMDTKAAIDDE